ncbi:hypothetical protein C8J57DRAFT_1723866 [Mycena rebaudengoi]|nr:hypothetical protein C8J57DRAFT_1723866 [Mycena rebaudengoi]
MPGTQHPTTTTTSSVQSSPHPRYGALHRRNGAATQRRVCVLAAHAHSTLRQIDDVPDPPTSTLPHARTRSLRSGVGQGGGAGMEWGAPWAWAMAQIRRITHETDSAPGVASSGESEPPSSRPQAHYAYRGGGGGGGYTNNTPYFQREENQPCTPRATPPAVAPAAHHDITPSSPREGTAPSPREGRRSPEGAGPIAGGLARRGSPSPTRHTHLVSSVHARLVSSREDVAT